MKWRPDTSVRFLPDDGLEGTSVVIVVGPRVRSDPKPLRPPSPD